MVSEDDRTSTEGRGFPESIPPNADFQLGFLCPRVLFSLCIFWISWCAEEGCCQQTIGKGEERGTSLRDQEEKSECITFGFQSVSKTKVGKLA